jgi:hypothetical protein
MSLEEPGTELTSDADEPNRDESEEDDETAGLTEPATPLIDQDVAGSVNAAIHDTDE